jgi:hypothetical protein
VDVLQDSQLLVTPYREFERQFGGKTVLAGLRLKKQLCKGRLKNYMKFDLIFFIASGDFYLSAPVRPTRISRRHDASVWDRAGHEEMELISTRHFDKFSVWSHKPCVKKEFERQFGGKTVLAV